MYHAYLFMCQHQTCVTGEPLCIVPVTTLNVPTTPIPLLLLYTITLLSLFFYSCRKRYPEERDSWCPNCLTEKGGCKFLKREKDCSRLLFMWSICIHLWRVSYCVIVCVWFVYKVLFLDHLSLPILIPYHFIRAIIENINSVWNSEYIIALCVMSACVCMCALFPWIFIDNNLVPFSYIIIN